MCNIITCSNCGHQYDVVRWSCCPRCSEMINNTKQSTDNSTALLFDKGDPTPLFYPDPDLRNTKLAKSVVKKFDSLENTGEHPQLILIRSYEQGHRGWLIEFSHRSLTKYEYLVRPFSLKLPRVE